MMSTPIIYENGRKIERNDFINFNKEKIYNGKECYKFGVYGVEVWDDILKKSFLLENKNFFKNRLLHEDELFTSIARIKANRIKVTDIKFYYYRQRSESITKLRDKLNEISCIYIFTKLLFNKDLSENILRKCYFGEY